MNKTNNLLDLQLDLQYNNYLSLRLLNILLSIERTISLAFSDITNLETISDSELLTIINHLKSIYRITELIEIDNTHLFKILEFTKFRVFSAKDTITCILYVPILYESSYQYSRIYPIPNLHNQVLITPYKYHLRTARLELWTSELCKVIESQIVCCEKPSDDKCSLKFNKNCTYASVNNNFKLYAQLLKGNVLVSCKNEVTVFEECPSGIESVKVKTSSLISSKNNCKLIIDDQTFENTFSNFSFKNPLEIKCHKTNVEINLQPEHLDDLTSLNNEAKTLQIDHNLHPAFHAVHFSVTFMIIILFCLVCILFYIRKRNLANKKEIEIIHLRNLTNVSHASFDNLQNEDVLS